MTNIKKTAAPKETTNNRPTDLEVLEARVNEAMEHHARLEAALTLAGHRAEAARWGLELPPGFDEMEAAARFSWLENSRPKFHSTPTVEGQTTWKRMQVELIGPLQTELTAASKSLSNCKEEFWAARNVHDLANADQLISDLEAQIGLAAKSVKTSAANIQRLNGDLTRLSLEQVEHAAAVQLNDEQLAQSVADGEPIDRTELVNSEAVAASIAKLITLTRQAVQKAQQAAQKDRQTLSELEGEKARLLRVKTRHRIVSGLAKFIDDLGSEGIERRELEAVLQSVNTMGIDRVLTEVG